MNTQLLIGAKETAARDGKTFDRLNPITGKCATRAAAASVEDANLAASAAAIAFPAWAEMGPSARRALLLKAADALEARAAEFTSAMMEETGATAAWAGFNVAFAAGIIREAAAMTTQITGEIIPSDTPGLLALAIRQPVGVILGIAPWNAPVILGVRAIAMPLACGNTIVLKASELCSRVHCLIGRAFRDAGFPDGVVNVVTNSSSDAAAIVEALIDHPAAIEVPRATVTTVVLLSMSADHRSPAAALSAIKQTGE